jgi:hypothetical protein
METLNDRFSVPTIRRRQFLPTYSRLGVALIQVVLTLENHETHERRTCWKWTKNANSREIQLFRVFRVFRGDFFQPILP